MARLAKPARPLRRAEADRAIDQESGPQQVRSLLRALNILKTLAGTGDGMTLADVAQIVGLAPSTAHRLLTTLESERFVRFDAEQHHWQIGVQAFTVGNAFARNRDVVAIARPYLRRLMEESGETANLYLAIDGEAICMAQVECRQMMRAIARPGGRVLMHCSGVGKAILAHVPETELGATLRRHGLPRLTERTLDTPKKLRQHLELVRARGWSLDDEEHAVGMRCVAAAIADEAGTPLAAISLSGPAARITDERVQDLGRLVQGIAGELTAAIGGVVPASVVETFGS